MAVTCRLVLVAALAPLVIAGGCRRHESSAPSDDAGAEPDAPVAIGELAVQNRKCGQCHQSPDPADGVLSGQTTPVPGTQAYGSNLTPDPDTGLDGWSADDIASALTQGSDPAGNTLCPAMPAYPDMTPDEAAAIAAYLQALPAVWRPIPASVCPPCEPPPDGGIAPPRSACEGDASPQGDP
jgi:hypothetical protein